MVKIKVFGFLLHFSDFIQTTTKIGPVTWTISNNSCLILFPLRWISFYGLRADAAYFTTRFPKGRNDHNPWFYLSMQFQPGSGTWNRKTWIIKQATVCTMYIQYVNNFAKLLLMRKISLFIELQVFLHYIYICQQFCEFFWMHNISVFIELGFICNHFCNSFNLIGVNVISHS